MMTRNPAHEGAMAATRDNAQDWDADRTGDAPDLETMEGWLECGRAMATDGCEDVDLDGECRHGYPSWLIELALI